MSQPAKDVLEHYRAAETLSENARARLLGALERRVAAGEAPAAGLDVPPPQGAVGVHGPLMKVIAGPIGKVGLALVLGAVPAAWLLTRGGDEPAAPAPLLAPPTSPKSETAAPEADEAKSPLSPAPVPAVALSGSAAGSGRSPASAERGGPAGVGRAPERAATPEPEPRVEPPANRGEKSESLERGSQPPSAQDTIDEEMSLLGAAHAALRAGRPADALAKLAEHRRRFPNGKLVQSREAARIIALCKAGQPKAARAAAERFLAAHPGSPLSSRVRNVCADALEKGR